jgi:hypothetical protein
MGVACESVGEAGGPTEPHFLFCSQQAGETKESVGFVSANASFGDRKLFCRERFNCLRQVRLSTNFASKSW